MCAISGLPDAMSVPLRVAMRKSGTNKESTSASVGISFTFAGIKISTEKVQTNLGYVK